MGSKQQFSLKTKAVSVVDSAAQLQFFCSTQQQKRPCPLPNQLCNYNANLAKSKFGFVIKSHAYRRQAVFHRHWSYGRLWNYSFGNRKGFWKTKKELPPAWHQKSTMTKLQFFYFWARRRGRKFKTCIYFLTWLTRDVFIVQKTALFTGIPGAIVRIVTHSTVVKLMTFTARIDITLTAYTNKLQARKSK